MTHLSSSVRPLLWPCLAVVLLALAACASGETRRARLVEALSQLERTASLAPPAAETAGILELGPDARAFVESRTAGIRDPYQKIRALRRAVFDPQDLDYALDDDLTLTADESYQRAAGNCVALANFFVAAVRHLGLDAGFQEVQRRRATRREADLRVVARHINVSGSLIWNRRQARYVLDYLSVPEEDFGRARPIPDRRAFAHYYNNLAIGYLQEEDLEKALQTLKRALLEDDNVDFVWSNLGVVYARRGDFEAAEFAYRRALSLNGDNPTAANNLEVLYRKWKGAGGAE